MPATAPSSPGTLALVKKFESTIRNNRNASESPKILHSPRSMRLSRSLRGVMSRSNSCPISQGLDGSNHSLSSYTGSNHMSMSSSELMVGLPFTHLERDETEEDDTRQQESAMEQQQDPVLEQVPKRGSRASRGSRVWIHLPKCV